MLLGVSCFIIISAFAYKKSGCRQENTVVDQPDNVHNVVQNNPIIKKYAQKLKVFADTNGYSTQYCFVINMKIASGKKRFFVYNMQKDSIEQSGLVTHGEGSETDSGLIFNNTPNALATSLGKYKIGKEYYGKFGLAYKLHGLDASNSKAFERFVVLHAHDCVPKKAIYPQEICVSQGCPTVNPSFLRKLKPIINTSAKHILLQIIYE